MLWIIALSWLFSGAFFCFLWVDWNSGFEKTSLWKKGWLQKMWQKKTTKRGLCGSHKKDYANHEVRMVGIFCGWGFCPAELPVINYQACLTISIIYCSRCQLHSIHHIIGLFWIIRYYIYEYKQYIYINTVSASNRIVWYMIINYNKRHKEVHKKTKVMCLNVV